MERDSLPAQRAAKKSAGGRVPESSGGSAWTRVEGWPPWRYPLYSATFRALGELVYRLAARQDSSRLVTYGVVVPGRLSRSGQPSLAGWWRLRAMGVRTVVNLRVEDDRARRLRQIGFGGYLHLPIPDGLPPTEPQAVAFLRFVTDPGHWPVHLHCLAGVQRSGTMVALVRYAVEGWTMDRALSEADALFPGLSRQQERWLGCWARRCPSGQWPWGSGDAVAQDSGNP